MMFTHKRKTKVQKLKRNNKRRLVAFYCVVIASSLFAVLGLLVLSTLKTHEALFVSPLPNLHALASQANDDEQVKLIKKSLQDKSITFTSVENNDEVYLIKLENGANVTLSAKKDIILQISSLQFVLSRLTMEGRQFRSLDLQYDKPIIVFKE